MIFSEFSVAATSRRTATIIVCLLLVACGGGSDAPAQPAVNELPGDPLPPADPPAPEPDPDPPPEPPVAITKAQLEAASRFASTATFGMPFEALEPLARQGYAAWLEEQFTLPVSAHTPALDVLVERRENGDLAGISTEFELYFALRRIAWWHQTVTAPDVLRQRTAFALSEIFVVSDSVTQLLADPYALSSYYDLLLDKAFGNFRDLLYGVALHPAMGIYLSHANNRSSNTVANTFPDENFARELMQLFSIGLFELNIDGSQKLDEAGRSIPTYANDDIREFAKIFTGLSFGGPDAYFGKREGDFRLPMEMFDEFHETGAKRLLNGTVVPDGQSGLQDIAAAIDHLFNHPNAGPFFARQLIQRLVTSNPSPSYIERVARTFNGEIGGVRGDLRAVLQAVLLDEEAILPPDPASNAGKLREPVVRLVGLLRQFNASAADGFIAYTGRSIQELARQHPLSSPSVFNFFLPGHSPAGDIATAGLVAPELEIVTSTTVVGLANLLDLAITANHVTDLPEPFKPMTLDLAGYIEVAGDADALIDRLDLVLTHGTLSSASRQVIYDAVSATPEAGPRVRTALYLFLISPDYTVRQ